MKPKQKLFNPEDKHKYFSEFSHETSMHGFKYITDERWSRKWDFLFFVYFLKA